MLHPLSAPYSKIKLTETETDEEAHGCFGTVFTMVTESAVFNMANSMRDIIILLLTLGVCVFCFLKCTPCLFIVIVFCFMFCCCAPYLNIPLWVAILFLLLGGFKWFPNSSLEIAWGGLRS